MNWNQFFHDNWSQTLVFIGVLGYFIRRIFDTRDKKNFRRFELFEEKRIEAFVKYSTSYSAYKSSLTYFVALLQNGDAITEWKELSNSYDQLKLSNEQLEFFLDKVYSEQFDKLFDQWNTLFIDCTKFFNQVLEQRFFDKTYSSTLLKEHITSSLREMGHIYKLLKLEVHKFYDV